MKRLYRMVKTIEVDIEVNISASSQQEAEAKADKIVATRVRQSGDLLIFTMGDLTPEEIKEYDA